MRFEDYSSRFKVSEFMFKVLGSKFEGLRCKV
jgi:hypothetical protein